jgi:hypothetical protein
MAQGVLYSADPAGACDGGGQREQRTHPLRCLRMPPPNFGGVGVREPTTFLE